jgi:hypothetical protein
MAKVQFYEKGISANRNLIALILSLGVVNATS